MSAWHEYIFSPFSEVNQFIGMILSIYVVLLYSYMHWKQTRTLSRFFTTFGNTNIALVTITDSIKINRPEHNIRMYWTNFWQPTVLVQQNVFEKNLIIDSSPHLYASFGTFYIQIGLLFEAQWYFKLCLKIYKSLLSKENVIDFEIFRMFKDLLWRE